MWIERAQKQGLVSGAGIAVGLLLGGCNSFDKPAEEVGPKLVIPTDDRPATTSPVRPHAVSGGTLSVFKDGSAALAADPDRDRLSIVDLQGPSLRASVALQPGDEPGRSVEDANQHMHVVLRGSGSIVSIDAMGNVLERRQVCKAPRGIAFDQATQLLHVACAEGALVSLPAAGGAATRTLQLQTDLRDVIVQGDKLWVTRFKTAEVLQVDANGAVANRVAIPKAPGLLSVPPPKSTGNGEEAFGSNSKSVTLSSGVAWRAVSNNAGGAVLVHQQEVDDEITISEPTANGSSYGGGQGGVPCDGIVKNAVTTVDQDGTTTTTPISTGPLVVDVAYSQTPALSATPDSWIAVAQAGPSDMAAPRPTLIFPSTGGDSVAPTAGGAFAGPKGGFGNVLIFSRANMQSNPGCAFADGAIPTEGPATAVAFTPSGQLLVQTQEPAQLAVVRTPPFDMPITIQLNGESRLDTGHELFHRDAGGGIACASCHPEGGEDGHVWHFADSGLRRTQSLQVGIQGTAPFHWAGDLADVGAVMHTVFVGRMGGVNQSAERTDTLSNWLFAMERPPAIRDKADAAVVRGKALFESASAGCSDCHNGAKFTNNQTVAIDSARDKLQVPSLVAVGYRSPFMHDGCAATLAARFDPACGGNSHGNVASLSEADKSDLIAYLESL